MTDEHDGWISVPGSCQSRATLLTHLPSCLTGGCFVDGVFQPHTDGDASRASRPRRLVVVSPTPSSPLRTPSHFISSFFTARFLHGCRCTPPTLPPARWISRVGCSSIDAALVVLRPLASWPAVPPPTSSLLIALLPCLPLPRLLHLSFVPNFKCPTGISLPRRGSPSPY